MKQNNLKTALVALASVLLVNSTFAQFKITQREASGMTMTMQGDDPLLWYKKKANRGLVLGNTNLLQTKTVGTNHSEVGVNLQRAQNVISPVNKRKFNTNSTGYCETQDVKMDYLNEGTFSLVNINQTFTPLVFPGAFINAASLLDKTPVMYTLATDRAPLTVSISITNPRSRGQTQTTVSDFGVNNINQLNTELRNRHFGAAIPPVFAYQLKEVTSKEHFTASLNYSVGLMLPLEEFGLPIDLSQGVKANADASLDKKMHSYVVSFIQPMYAYSVNEVDMNRFFTKAGLASQHSTAGFVSSVIFGRMAMITFQSTENAGSVNALVSERLGVTFTGGDLANTQVGVGVNASAKLNFSNKTKNFRAFVYGGNAVTALRLTSNPDEVFSFIQDSSAYKLSANSGALPIQYIINRVSDGKALGVRSTSYFTIEDCLNPKYDVTVKVTNIKCHKVVEAPFDDAEDIFGTCKIGGTVLFNIPENNPIHIKQNATASIDGAKKNVAASITFNNMKNLRLNFTPNLNDYEVLIKPQYREKQPGDLVFNFDNKTDQIARLEPGESVLIDGNAPKAFRLYENADVQASSISVLYQIEVTRK